MTAPLADLTTVLYVAWMALLAVASAVLLYLVVRRPQYLQHPDAMAWLAASLVAGVAGTVLEAVYWAGLLADPGVHVLAWLVIFAAGAAYAVSMWLFARDVLTQRGRTAPFEEFDPGEGGDVAAAFDAGARPADDGTDDGGDGGGAGEG